MDCGRQDLTERSGPWRLAFEGFTCPSMFPLFLYASGYDELGSLYHTLLPPWHSVSLQARC